MTCGTNECNIETKVRRELTFKRTEEQVKYGKLWAEIVLPKLMKGENFKW